MNIYVCNLSSTIQNDDLKGLFSPYGIVTSAEVVNDIVSGESRGYGYVEMDDHIAAQEAIDALDQSEIEHLIVSVKENKLG